MMKEHVFFSSEGFVTFILNEREMTVASMKDSLHWICPSVERCAILREEYSSSHMDSRDCNQYLDRSEIGGSSIGKWRIL